jgi:nitroreductase
MDVYAALYTTRAMRRVRPDPIPYDVQARILDAAIRAPSPGNNQEWRFLLVDDPVIKRQLAPLYQESATEAFNRFYSDREAAALANPETSGNAAALRGLQSSRHLAAHWADVPLFLFGFARNDPSGTSVIPALWNAMLAARAEGVGSTLTTLLGFLRPEETLRVLGVPEDAGWTMVACVPMGYPTGKWGIATRRPVDEVAARNTWDGPLGFSVPEPLWSPES